MRRCGYVYVDVLTTLLFMLLIYALFVGNMRNSLASGRRGACIHNLGQVGLALKLYALDNAGALPSQQAGLGALVDTYGADTGILACPEVALRARRETPRFLPPPADGPPGPAIDYSYRGGLSSDDLPTSALAADLHPQTHKKGANTLFVDGSVMWRSYAALDAGADMAALLGSGGLDIGAEERVGRK
ncbi:MAG TPA: hypothetical protein DGT21_23130 [Armatimonadetes bacterium]|nr:hypothetical protein [Armatimonadota bacterium]